VRVRVCACLYVYACVSLCMHVYACVCVRARARVYVRICVGLRSCVRIQTHRCVCAFVCVHVCMELMVSYGCVAISCSLAVVQCTDCVYNSATRYEYSGSVCRFTVSLLLECRRGSMIVKQLCM